MGGECLDGRCQFVTGCTFAVTPGARFGVHLLFRAVSAQSSMFPKSQSERKCIVAQQVSVKLVDDIDGSEAADTVSFAIDGRDYELDLSEKNAAKLRDALSPFVASARRGAGRRKTTSGGGPKRSQRPTERRERTAAIRQWARQHGHTVADRGRIPASVIEAYEKGAG
jgi:hypothetical protein